MRTVRGTRKGWWNLKRKSKTKAKKQRLREQRDIWVSWFSLLNKSKRQTLDGLREYLIEKGLSDGDKATEKAFKLRYVMLVDGKERWHLGRYIKMMMYDNRKKKRSEKSRTEGSS